MSCHPPARQIGLYRPEDGPHDRRTGALASADLHVKPYAKRHVKVYADSVLAHNLVKIGGPLEAKHNKTA
jgi:hypothetical protein